MRQQKNIDLAKIPWFALATMSYAILEILPDGTFRELDKKYRTKREAWDEIMQLRRKRRESKFTVIEA